MLFLFFQCRGPKTDHSSSSYPTTWNPTQMPIPASATGSYPATTISADSYPKMPLSGATSFTAEPQELPLQQTSMPSVQLSLVASDHHQQAPIRTQYAYVHGSTSAPPQLSLPTTADSGLSVPRYVDSNPRPAKSPRHASHQSVHSSGSISNTDGSNEYRYGPPYVGVNSNSSEMSPSQQSHSAGYGPGGPDASSNPPSATAPSHPPRDYFPSTASWTSTAGETNTPTYANGDQNRPYAFPDHYKTGTAGAKADHAAPHAYPAPRGSFDAMNNYSWNTT